MCNNTPTHASAGGGKLDLSAPNERPDHRSDPANFS